MDMGGYKCIWFFCIWILQQAAAACPNDPSSDACSNDTPSNTCPDKSSNASPDDPSSDACSNKSSNASPDKSSNASPDDPSSDASSNANSYERSTHHTGPDNTCPDAFAYTCTDASPILLEVPFKFSGICARRRMDE